MVLAIIAVWAIIIPLVVLAISWESANRREARDARAKSRRGAQRRQPALPRCVARTPRPRRTVTRRRCPELPRTRRRPASA